MSRKTVDCRALPNEVGCTLTISGEEEEVLAASMQHAISVHGHTEPREELQTALRGILQDELLATPR
jgi:predicted small metal-binding protein